MVQNKHKKKIALEHLTKDFKQESVFEVEDKYPGFEDYYQVKITYKQAHSFVVLEKYDAVYMKGDK